MSPLVIAGTWLDGQSSHANKANLRLQANEVTLELESGVTHRISLKDITISPKIGRTARQVEFAEVIGKFESSDIEQLDLLSKHCKRGLHEYLHILESNLLMVAVACLFVVSLGIGYLLWGIPYASKVIAQNLPENILQQASNETMLLLEKRYLNASTLSDQSQEAFKELIARNSPEYDITKLHIRDGGEIGANAFALPDGSIIFTDQLITLADGNEAEILGVFGHELGHVHHRHSLQHILQGSAIALTVALIGGDVSAFGDIVLTLPIVFTQLSFSRNFELESDAYGAKYLKDRNLAPSALASMLQKLHDSHVDCDTEATGNPSEENNASTEHDDDSTLTNESAEKTEQCKSEKGVVDYLSSHPYIDDRIETIHAYE